MIQVEMIYTSEMLWLQLLQLIYTVVRDYMSIFEAETI